jgi:peptide deformylase
MALLPILVWPDPRLKTVAKPVTQFNAHLAQLAQDMAQTMYEAPGIGLAATQVDVHERLIVLDISEDKSGLMTLVNPEIMWASEALSEYEEGCLSVPEIYDGVERHAKVKVRAQDVQGNPFEFEADGLLAVCVQHEMDHLNGKVFVEYLSSLKQDRIRTKLKKRSKKSLKIA